MAVAAEQVRQQTDTVDWDPAEVQLSAERPVETEIHGRSLSTCYRFGKFAVDKSREEVINSSEAEQLKEEFCTSVEEGFGTDIKLGDGLKVCKFWSCPIVDGKITSKNGTAISDITARGLLKAQEKASIDKRFLPQLTRSKWDHQGSLINDKMARGETDYNVRIVASPCPVEAIEQNGGKYWQYEGYVPHLGRGFIWVYYVGEEGVVGGTISFDGTNKERLREVFGRRGVDIPETEITDNWPKYEVTDTLSVEEAKKLAIEMANEAADPKYKKTTNTVEVTSEHRQLMDTVFNESYIHACESLARGRQTPAARKLIFQLADKAGDFDDRFAEALYRMRANEEQFTDDDMIVLHELLVYSTIEMMRTLHLQKMEPSTNSDIYVAEHLNAAYLQSLDAEAFQMALSDFGAEGARNNHVYSACGLAIAPGKIDNADGGAQNPFGGLTAELSRKKWMNCPFCKARVFDDPCAKVLCCKECKAKVVNGHIAYKGNGGRKEQAKKEVAKKRQEVELAKQVDEAYEEKGLSEQEFGNQKIAKAVAMAAYN